MHLLASFLVLLMLGVNLKCIAAQTQRPYAFGFTIDKQQHRSEKKDERGIVMGEFGFITADGIYHVTVYATDEEGKFRILAMRSYPYEARPKTIEMVVAPQQRPALSTTTTARAPPQALPRHNFANPACSGCFLTNNAPKKATEATAPKNTPGKVDIRPLSRTLGNGNNNKNNNGGVDIASKNGKKIAETLLPQILSNVQQTSTTMRQAKSNVHPPLKAAIDAKLHRTLTVDAAAESKISALTATRDTIIPHPDIPKRTPAVKSAAPSVGSFNPKNPKLQPGSGSSGSGGGAAAGKPIGAGGSAAGGAAGAGRAGASGGNGAGGVGAKGTGSDTGDLYRFKYILDYNGHTETGSRNGNKQGSFFAIGDDNVERTIEYIANEFGYQPRIRWRKLDAPVQAKENTLKDYEFVWFKKE